MSLQREPRFRLIVGTGAVGAGVVFHLEGNHDLGRNESRRAELLDHRDFFKLHIILHYVARLLGEAGVATRIVPVSAVGDDEAGRRLRAQMREAGVDLRHLRVRRDAPTAFGVAFTYPDASGGNLAPTNAAPSLLDAAAIREAEPEIAKAGRRCLVLGAPEVSLETRRALLEIGRAHGAFAAASFVSGELAGVEVRDHLRLVDLLALNIDEAASVAGVRSRDGADRIVAACVDSLSGSFPGLLLSISDGERGAYAWQAGKLEHLPALEVPVASTAGAGDAMLSGYLIGLTIGLPFLGAPCSCFRLARLLAAMSVMSADTINFDIGLRSLRAFAAGHGEESPL